MKDRLSNRRNFIKRTATAAGVAWLSGLTNQTIAAVPGELSRSSNEPVRIRFSVININHAHINSMVGAVKRGGGELVSLYAKEPDLIAAFTKQFPEVKLATSEKEILEDASIQVILSSGIPDERAPLGVRVMQHGKDYLVDKPGIITLEQLATARRVQKETGRIYSIMFSERFENSATVKAGELVKAGAIGKVIQTIG
ncbi:MAG: twin-arginine translocation signal domain-containing protein, partial [Ferruginibacter sp.]